MDLAPINTFLQAQGFETIFNGTTIRVRNTDRCMRSVPGLFDLVPDESWIICHCNSCTVVQTHEARMEEIERRRDAVLAEYNPNLPTYEAR